MAHNHNYGYGGAAPSQTPGYGQQNPQYYQNGYGVPVGAQHMPQGYGAYAAHPHHNTYPGEHFQTSAPQPPMQRTGWNPLACEAHQIDIWFKELDSHNRGTAGGIEIANFFKRTELSVDILRSIWQIVDSNNSGHVNRVQFTVLVRLISLACSPIYKVAVPSLDLYYRTAHDSIAFPAALTGRSADSLGESATAPVVPPSSALAPQPEVSIVGKDEDDEFTDFASAPKTPANLEASAWIALEDDNDDFGPMTSATSNVDLATLQDDSEDEFGPMSAAPSTSGLADFVGQLKESENPFDALVEPVERPTSASGGLVDDDIIELDLMTDLTGSSAIAPEPPSVPIATFGVDGVDDDDDFGDFSDVKPRTLAEASSVSMNKMSVFDDLVEQDMQMALGGGDDDWDEFATAENPEPENHNLNGEGDAPSAGLGDAGADIPQESEFADFDADFTDFESAPVKDTTAPPLTAPLPAVTASKELALSNPESGPTTSDDFGNDDDEDFGDFGNFETSPMPGHDGMAQQQSQPSDADQEPGASSVHASGFLLDFLSEEGPVAPQNGFPPPPPPMPTRPPATAPTITSDSLLDFLNDDIPPPPSSAAPAIPNSSSNNSLHGDLTFLSANLAPIQPSKSVSISASGAPDIDDDDDDFGDFSEAPGDDAAYPAAGNETPVSHSSPMPAMGKHLSVSELEEIILILVSKNHFELAYNCAEHCEILKEVMELKEAMQTALASNEPEMAAQLKRAISDLDDKLSSSAQELVWCSVAASDRCAPTLRENAELIEALNPSAWTKYKSRYLEKQPPANASVKNKIAFSVRAKRSARMIIAVHSTHQKHPAAWKLLILTAMGYAKDGHQQLSKYNGLSAADQATVLQHKKMQTYVESIKYVVECCIILCVCCAEAMVHEEMAAKAYNACLQLHKSIRSGWKMSSDLPAGTVDALSVEAGKYAERSGVTYCDFTLRPVAVQEDGHGRMLQAYVESQGKNYLQTAANLWQHDMQTPLPPSDGVFE